MRKDYLQINILHFCLGISLLLFGCSKEPETQGFINIDDQYEIQLHQDLTPEGGQPALHVSSLEPHECTNSYISYQTLVSEEKLQLFLHDILTEGECETGNEIVSEHVPIAISSGSLPIEINLKNVVKNSGTLYTDDIEFDLKLDRFDGLKISKTTINKIHPRMIWGSYSLSNQSIADEIQVYLHDVDDITAIHKGDFGHFYLAQDNSVVIYGEEEKEERITFLITNKKDLSEFESKFQEFKLLDQSLTIQATNFDGSTLIIE